MHYLPPTKIADDNLNRKKKAPEWHGPNARPECARLPETLAVLAEGSIGERGRLQRQP